MPQNFFGWPQGYQNQLSGCVSERGDQGIPLFKINKSCYKFLFCVNEPQSYLKIKYSLDNPNLNRLYLVIQVGSTGMNKVLDCRQHLWPGTIRWPLYKHHSGNTKALKIWKLCHGFKISQILANLCHMYFFFLMANKYLNDIYCLIYQNIFWSFWYLT